MVNRALGLTRPPFLFECIILPFSPYVQGEKVVKHKVHKLPLDVSNSYQTRVIIAQSTTLFFG